LQSKLLKIKLKKGSRPHLEKLLVYMKENYRFPLNEMEQKGYFWDSVFLDGEDQLYIVLKSADFSKIMENEEQLIATPFREIYDNFRNDCWSSDPYEDIESLASFNRSFTFLGSKVPVANK
jgi:hypothetical protein